MYDEFSNMLENMPATAAEVATPNPNPNPSPSPSPSPKTVRRPAKVESLLGPNPVHPGSNPVHHSPMHPTPGYTENLLGSNPVRHSLPP